MSITLDVLRPTFHPSEEDLEEVDSEDISARDANVKAVFSSVQDHWDLIASIYKKRVRNNSQSEASNTLSQPIRGLRYIISANQRPLLLFVSESEARILLSDSS